MDRRFQSDLEWFISPVISVQDFLYEATNAESVAKGVLGASEGADDNSLRQNFVEQTACSSKVADKIFDQAISLDILFDKPGERKTFQESSRYGYELRPTELRTHHYMEARDKWCGLSKQRKSAYVKSMKYDSFNGAELGSVDKMLRNEGNDFIPTDVVILVTVNVPYNRILSPTEMRSSRLMKPATKFMVRGETSLLDFRRKLVCDCDVVVPLKDGNELEAPDMQETCAELFPSAFIFINDTFYIDRTHDNAVDLSEPIREFMKRKKIFDPVKAVDIEGVNFIDLKLRLGQPYVFQHSGSCEHLLTFHELRLIHSTDIQEIYRYPLLVFERWSEKKCECCKRVTATYVIDNSELLPNAFTNFCDGCFREFNFPNGIKSSKFRAWPLLEQCLLLD
ncbi:unnamed protein product [Caenorhabditis auriculariae]|uniref:Small nuclear RNA-activating complex polypeptide 3 n=1 Tax=Caenorhabditis auriculariae TaxID=2777116 RepID=A0A8S1H730_9PELO|nr:unnamed protein product [Caenorhabditis auriculariae]